MINRKFPIIAFCSGNGANKNSIAEQIGTEIIQRRHILLTGGRAGGGTPKDCAMKGVLSASKAASVAPLVGVLPSDRQQLAVEERQLLLHTGLTSEQRDPIIGVTPDAIIALSGAEGTLAEIAFALSAGVQVVLLNSRQSLRSIFEFTGLSREKVPRNQEIVARFRNILIGARKLYGKINGTPVNENGIEQSLQAFLADPPDGSIAGGNGDIRADAADAVTKAISLIKRNGPNGKFPGIPSAWGLRQEFDELLQQIEFEEAAANQAAPAGG